MEVFPVYYDVTKVNHSIRVHIELIVKINVYIIMYVYLYVMNAIRKYTCYEVYFCISSTFTIRNCFGLCEEKIRRRYLLKPGRVPMKYKKINLKKLKHPT